MGKWCEPRMRLPPCREGSLASMCSAIVCCNAAAAAGSQPLQGQHDCDHGEDVGVECAADPSDLPSPRECRLAP